MSRAYAPATVMGFEDAGPAVPWWGRVLVFVGTAPACAAMSLEVRQLLLRALVFLYGFAGWCRLIFDFTKPRVVVNCQLSSHAQLGIPFQGLADTDHLSADL